MTDKVGGEINMVCRQAQKRFAALDERVDTARISVTERAATEHHLQTCSRCAIEYRLFALQRATLDAAAMPEPITPDEDFFRALRARIARGPELAPSRRADESWSAALLVTARQLVPAMAILLLLMIGATFLWNQAPSDTREAAVRPRERVMFSDMYDYPAPTRDDVLETLVAVEEK
jgi:predicted anti-sigma-YlaC factor YlaD